METSKRLPTSTLVLGIAVLLLILGGWLALRSDAPSSSDPPSPQAESVRFVGSAKCAACHVEQYENYQASGHSRTFWTTKEFPFREQFDGLKFQDPERNSALEYVATESGLEVGIAGKFEGRRFPLQFAFGSGEHAVTFMTLIPGGIAPLGIEHRASWFSGQDKAGITPGQLRQPIQQDAEHFGRFIEGEALEKCFECHTTSFRIEGDQLTDLLPNVGCESCHTAGALHAEAMQGDGPANAGLGFEARPWRTKDQIRICARCHRGEENVDEREIRRDNWKLVRFQPVGLVQSECFKRSEKMVCSTCHDPHQHASKRTPLEYERKCLSCHQTGTDSDLCPVSPAADCVSCHMPRVEVHPSISFHDHWIRVRGEGDPPAVIGKDE